MNANGHSLLDLLHPRGAVDRWRQVGCRAVGTLAPAIAPDGSDGAPAPDLVLLAPSPAERRSFAWLRRAREEAAAIGTDGLVVAVEPPAGIGRSLANEGLEPALRLVHVPDVERSRYVFPVSGPAARIARAHIVPMSPRNRALLGAVSVAPGLSTLGPTSLIFRRAEGLRPLAWLARLGEPVSSCSAILVRSWRPGGGTVLIRFGGGRVADTVVKVGRGATAEAEGVETVAPGAAGAGFTAPRLLGRGTVGDEPFVAESPMPGRSASMHVDGAPDRAHSLLDTLAGLLNAWSLRSLTRRPLVEADVERLLLEPAERLAPALPDGYPDRLREEASGLLGSEVPFVAAHNDLTAANVIVAADGRLGLTDWEEAEQEALPLGDLAYAAADFMAAASGYRDRVAAFRDCFDPAGRFQAITGDLITAASRSVGIDKRLAGLALQACWLRHADDESRAADPEDGDRPFLEIARRAAQGWGR